MRKGFTLIELMIVVAIIAIIAAIAIPSLLRSRIAANEGNAASGLKQLTSHEASFRQTEADGNGLKDYWTGDVVGFYAVEDAGSNMVKYIDVQMAKADDNSLTAAGCAEYSWTGADATGIPKTGYLYRALTQDEDAVAYAADPDGDGNSYTNQYKFAFGTFPAEYATTGVNIFIVNEEGVVYSVDNGESAADAPKGAWATAWPGPDPTDVTAASGNRWAVAAD